jgi:branched-chain amino acid transport system ATP-binding protein
VLSVCDRVVVLDSGAVIAQGTPAEIRGDERVIAAYLGHASAGTAGAPS